MYQARIPVGPDIYRGCAYTVLQTGQMSGVYSAAYGAVYYEEPLKSFEIRVGHSPAVKSENIPPPSQIIPGWIVGAPESTPG